MDFFRSVFTDEPDPPPPKSASDAETSPEHQSNSDSDSESPPTQPHSNPSDGGSGWSNFGGLIRTLTTKSESVIETYRRDLQEFSTGLRKEIEVAQGSLENVGQAFDEIGTSVIKGTAQIISHGKEAILSLDHESDSSDIDVRGSSAAGQSSSYDSRRYSRFDAQVSAIQGDASTFCDEPEDMEDYGKWRSWEFALQDNRDEIESLLEENGTLDAIYKKVVPGSVDEETFWARYYYRIYKLKQAEALRANLVKRAISAEEEDLSWDVDDDDDDDERNGGNGGSCKDSDYSVVSSHQTAAEEEDLGWDEIEDLSGIDDSKKEERRVSQSGSNATKEELRKRLSVAEEEEEEDLSWDIEDDDEPIKA
ncbi:unnamed protein product [Linum tenue]|uniref:BSD domain-containing protein n=1 Tax=Linum tenue TaxID=586396 RepID=A0AAV0RW87_9ROSI|nr:unnamed protein product [Linum tenue]